MNIQLPEELDDLLLSRKIRKNDSVIFQTLSGHLYDLLSALRWYIETRRSRLSGYCSVNNIDFNGLCGMLFICTGLINIKKAGVDYQDDLRMNRFRKQEPADIDSNIIFVLMDESIHRKTKECKTDPEEFLFKLQSKSKIMQFWNYLFDSYKRLGFGSIFELPELPSEALLKIFERELNTNKKREASGTKKSGYTGKIKLMEIWRNSVFTCGNIADRAFLQRIINEETLREFIVIGSCLPDGGILQGINRSRRIIQRGSKSSGNGYKCLEVFMSNNINDKYDRLLNRIKNENENARLIVITQNESSIISFCRKISADLKSITVHINSTGTYRFKAKSFARIDTAVYSVDDYSESLNSIPPDVSSISLYTYRDFFRKFNGHNMSETGFMAEILLSHIIVFDVFCFHSQMEDNFRNLFKFIRKNNILTSVAGFAHDVRMHRAIELFFRKAVSDYNQVNEFAGRFQFEIRGSFIEKNRLEDDFRFILKKNFRDGLNQIIICPNPLIVQQFYHLAWNEFKNSKLSVSRLELSHSLYATGDKITKCYDISSKIKRGPVLFIVTPGECFDLFGKFQAIYLYNIPAADALHSVFCLSNQIKITGKNRISKIYYDKTSTAPDDTQFKDLFTDSVKNESVVQFFKKVDAAERKLQDKLRIDNELLMAVPVPEADKPYEYDLNRSFRIPACSASEHKRILSGGHDLYKHWQRHDRRFYISNMPYHVKSGLIIDPVLKDEYIY